MFNLGQQTKHTHTHTHDREFSTGMAFKKSVQEFITELDNCPKPTVAAIHGTALGGGLEIALACHYRVGTARCKVGLPEVLLGLLPGAGGTQRLPRLIGPMLAAELIASGQHVRAQRAENIGILDRVVDILPNHQVSMEQLILRSAAMKFATEISSLPVQDRIISQRKVEPLNEFFYNMLRQQISKGARGFIAPELCIQAVQASTEVNTFEEGLKRERELFMKLATGTQSRALQYVFFAQREITKVPGVDTSLAKKIKSVGIIGCGTMGGGILMNFVQKGIPVTVLETKQSFLDRGLSVVQGNWMRQVKKGKLPKKRFEKYVSLIKPTLKYEDLSDVCIFSFVLHLILIFFQYFVFWTGMSQMVWPNIVKPKRFLSKTKTKKTEIKRSKLFFFRVFSPSLHCALIFSVFVFCFVFFYRLI